MFRVFFFAKRCAVLAQVYQIVSMYLYTVATNIGNKHECKHVGIFVYNV